MSAEMHPVLSAFEVVVQVVLYLLQMRLAAA